MTALGYLLSFSFLSLVKKIKALDFPGGLVGGTSPSNAGGARSTRDPEAKIPHTLQPKNQNVKQKSESGHHSVVSNSL